MKQCLSESNYEISTKFNNESDCGSESSENQMNQLNLCDSTKFSSEPKLSICHTDKNFARLRKTLSSLSSKISYYSVLNYQPLDIEIDYSCFKSKNNEK